VIVAMFLEARSGLLSATGMDVLEFYPDAREADQYGARLKFAPWGVSLCHTEAILLHDLFHHHALGVGYSRRGEYLTAHLDPLYPWIPEQEGKMSPDVERLRREMAPDEVPTREEEERFLAHARATLGGLVPYEFAECLDAAFRGLLAVPPMPDTLWRLSLDTDAKRADLEQIGPIEANPRWRPLTFK
jgi:hypothetical protein